MPIKSYKPFSEHEQYLLKALSKLNLTFKLLNICKYY
jgi:hypothetical protein